MKNISLLFCLFIALPIHSQETREPLSSNNSKLELFLKLGGNSTQFNLPTTGFNFTNLSGYGASVEAGLLWMKLDPSQPLDLAASGRLGYNSYNLQSDSDTLDINRSVRGLSLGFGIGLHHRQIVCLTLNLGYFKSLSDADQTRDSFLGGIRFLVKIPINANVGFGFNGMVGGFFNNAAFKEFQSEGMFLLEGGISIHFGIR